MEVGVGAARYRDLNSDLPSCISKFHIQDGHEPILRTRSISMVGFFLSLADCPPHNIVHDIMHCPNYYDPLYYPKYYPELFATPSSVKLWLETSLCSHISLCCPCSSRHHITFWKLNSHRSRNNRSLVSQTWVAYALC